MGWDFSAYVLNARHLFFGADYYEVVRPPLVSLIIGIFLFLGKISEYIYILIVSVLFFYSIIKLSDVLYEKYFCKFKIKKEFVRFLFYFIGLNGFVLVFGLREGSELLSISFFILFLSSLIKDKISGHYLALAFLTRYSFFVFLPLLLFNWNLRKIIKNLIIFFLVSFPWFLYNYLKWGNWFTSLADSFYMNVVSRQDAVWEFSFLNLFSTINIFIPFFILGLFFFFYKLFRKKENLKYDLLFFVIGIFVLSDIIVTPTKLQRYYFNFIIPVIYFSSLGIVVLFNKLKKKENSKKILLGILIFSFLIVVFVVGFNYFQNKENSKVFFEASKDIQELNLSHCSIVSPHFVPVNYYSGNVHYLGDFEWSINRGEIVLIFNSKTRDDSYLEEDLGNYNLLLKREKYSFFVKEGINSSNCFLNYKDIFPGISDPCKDLSFKFEKIGLGNYFLKFCKFIN
ncbi:hypothetical protein HOD88_00540 [archaeon]|nr:hypothetical protein [archaeon]